MKLVMTLLVRDEADIVAANLDYHFAQGVDLAIVTDNRSRDETLEILRGYEGSGRVHVLSEEGEDFRAWHWRTRMSRLAAEKGATWVIPNDADEFWWPRRGTLKETFLAYAEGVGVVRAGRSNFAPRPDDGRPFFERLTLREVESKNPIGKPLPPKIAHRASPTVEVGQGSHRVDGVPGERLEDDAVEVLHFPWRSYEQFERKVITLGEAYRRNTELGPGTGRARRWLYEVWERGELPDYYAGKLVAGGALPEGLVEDTRLRDFMRELEAAPAAP
jgi:hypothetical protein